MKQMVYLMGIVLVLACAGNAWAGDYTYPPASADGYYDIATGHKYMKNPDNTYSEYSKRGKLLRSDVPNTAPLLVSGKYTYEMTPNHYIVYEKRESNNTLRQQVLPASSSHPQGWRCKQMFTAVQGVESATAEAYEPAK